MKKFVIIGLGSFGSNAAKVLSSKGNDVIAIDTDNKKIDELKEYNIHTLLADATKIDVLENIDIHDADDVIVSLGPNIEPSILVVHNLKKMNIKNIIAKALSEEHASILGIIGADRIIYPEKDEAVRLANILNSKNLIDFIPLSNANGFNLFEILCPNKYHGKTIREIDVRRKYNILIIGILDKYHEGKFELPDPDITLNENHTILLLGTEKDVNKFL